jgi:hypothetical protein
MSEQGDPTDALPVENNRRPHLRSKLEPPCSQRWTSPRRSTSSCSRNLTCVNTHEGLLRYRRLHMGISCASEIFTEQIRVMLQDMTGSTEHDGRTTCSSSEKTRRTIQKALLAVLRASRGQRPDSESGQVQSVYKKVKPRSTDSVSRRTAPHPQRTELAQSAQKKPRYPRTLRSYTVSCARSYGVQVDS